MLPKLRDVHVKNLRTNNYESLKEWISNPKHLYIGRRNIFVEGANQSKYHNPFPVKKYGIEESIKSYYQLWKDKDVKELLEYEEIGCWCMDYEGVPTSINECKCHGQVLLFILSNQIK